MLLNFKINTAHINLIKHNLTKYIFDLCYLNFIWELTIGWVIILSLWFDEVLQISKKNNMLGKILIGSSFCITAIVMTVIIRTNSYNCKKITLRIYIYISAITLRIYISENKHSDCLLLYVLRENCRIYLVFIYQIQVNLFLWFTLLY